MSLINRMLKDIETRKPKASREPQSERIRQLSLTASAAKPERSGNLWWWGFAVSLLGAGVWWLLF